MAGTGRSVFAELRFKLAKRSTEQELARLINTMEGHKAADLPAGSRSYKILHNDAQQSIERLQRKAQSLGLEGPSYAEVSAKVPQLRALDNMANGSGQQAGMAIKIVGGGIGLMLVITILTVLAAYCHNLYAVLTHLSWVPK